MYRNRNLDIAIAAVIAILGGLAAAQRLPGLERALTTLGMALIFPILGGFLFYGLHIPLFKSSWIGLLVVLTLLGVVAVAGQRLREVPVGQPPQPGRSQQPPRQSGSVALNSFIFGLAA